MFFRNKKTGEIRIAQTRVDGIYLYDETTGYWHKYELPLLAEDWEYYVEPKDDAMRVIDDFIQYVEEEDDLFRYDESVGKFVKKLKAWRRLKDKGFRFRGVGDGWGEIYYSFPNAEDMFENSDIRKDLDLLFGGEE